MYTFPVNCLDLLSDIWLAINYYFNKNEDLLHHSVRVLMIFFHLHARAIAIISWNTPSVLPDFFQGSSLNALPLDLPLPSFKLFAGFRTILLDQFNDYSQLIRRKEFDSIEDGYGVQIF
jgi:hypothetical protein